MTLPSHVAKVSVEVSGHAAVGDDVVGLEVCNVGELVVTGAVVVGAAVVGALVDGVGDCVGLADVGDVVVGGVGEPVEVNWQSSMAT